MATENIWGFQISLAALLPRASLATVVDAAAGDPCRPQWPGLLVRSEEVPLAPDLPTGVAPPRHAERGSQPGDR